MSDAIAVLGAARTPFTKFGGVLRDATHPELSGVAVRAALARAGVTPAEVDELALGVNLPGADRSIARQASLAAGIPVDRVAYTVDRACCSSVTASALAARSLALGDARIAVAGGAENMSRTPYFLTGHRWGHPLGDVTLRDQLVISCPITGRPRAVQAGEEAVEFGISRPQQDEWAVRSHTRYADALDEGKLADELVDVDIDGTVLVRAADGDGGLRRDTTAERLSRLATVYGSPTVTAGNAPGLSSGASALVLSTLSHAMARGIAPLATLHGWSMVSGDPDRIASIPATALSAALTKTGLGLHDLELIEVNEAFAAVPLVTTKALAAGDETEAEMLRTRVNVNGGAIAIGHPTGATGARLIMTAMFELLRRHGQNPGRPHYAGVTICGGIGEAEAVIVAVGSTS